MGHEQHTVAIFAPVLHLTVTVESGSSDQDEIHVHPGGQGFWVARMLRHLGERPLICGPIGGEAGKVLQGLLGAFGMDLSPIDAKADTPAIIQDRRSGDRELIAQSPPISLARHEIDDIYGRFLDRALAAQVCVVTGQSEEIFPPTIYRRLGHDLAAGAVGVVADLHGPELWEFLADGKIDVLKVSDEDLASDGFIDTTDIEEPEAFRVLAELRTAGADAVVLSRQDEPALARFGNTAFRAMAPGLEPADHRGAGDSMTAGLAAAFRQGLEPSQMMRLACAAGAANVTRHGLGSADSDLIPNLMDRIEIHELEGARA